MGKMKKEIVAQISKCRIFPGYLKRKSKFCFKGWRETIWGIKTKADMNELSGDSEKASPTRSEGVCGRAVVDKWGGAKLCRVFK